MTIRAWASALVLLAAVHGGPAHGADTLELGVNELAQAIVQNARENGARTIAVAPFPHTDDRCSELSNYIVDELILSLFLISDAGLQIVERSQLRAILGELGLGLTGAIDTNTAQQIGRLHGVDSMVVGSLTVVGDRLRIIARMIGTETGLVNAAAATTIPVTETVSALMARTAAAGCDATGQTASATLAPPPVGAQATPLAPPTAARAAEVRAIADAFFIANEKRTTAAYREFLAQYGGNPSDPYVRLASVQLELSISSGFPRARSLPRVPPLGSELLPAMAQSGDPVAQYYYARMFLQDAVVPVDYEEVVRWARLSAESNHPGGQALLGSMYRSGLGGLTINDAESLFYFRLAADQGYAEGQVNLGHLYRVGDGGLTPDLDAALQLYEAAANQGYAPGQYYLGRWGWEDSNSNEAIRLYRLAVEQGFGAAQYALGYMYEHGRGDLSVDLTEAVRLYALAAAQGVRIPISWRDDPDRFRGMNGSQIAYSCPDLGAASLDLIRGTDVYTDGSPICVAAVHAGVITRTGGAVTIEILPGRVSYTGTARNGITSLQYGSWGGSFRVVRPGG